MYFLDIELKDKFDMIWALNQQHGDNFVEFTARVSDYVAHVVHTEKLLEEARPTLSVEDFNNLHFDRDTRRTQLHNALIRAGKALNDGNVRSKGIALFDTGSEKHGSLGERERWAEIANHLFLRLECGKIVTGELAAAVNIIPAATGISQVTGEYLSELQRLLRVGYPRLTGKDGDHPADGLRLYYKNK